MPVAPVSEMAFTDRTLVVRSDLNVPLRDGTVADATRIDRFAAGMRPLLDAGASMVVLSHLGRPMGERRPEYSLAPVAPVLAARLGRDVRFCEKSPDNCAAPATRLAPGEVMLCENLRFDPREEANDAAFAAELARLGDIYVNDAFSCAHRAHASNSAIAEMMPSAAGPLLLEEMARLTAALEAPDQPAVAIIGGARVSTKVAVLKNLVTRLDAVIIGGAMANTFFLADGMPVGRSLCEPEHVGTVAEIRALAAASGCQIMLPTDIVYAYRLERGAKRFSCKLGACPDEAQILDAGPNSVRSFATLMSEAQTILWNGPLGAFETPPFDQATRAMAMEAAELSRQGLAITIAGGGDTVAALNAAGVAEDFTHISTAGGAFLEWLEGKELPGIAALRRNN